MIELEPGNALDITLKEGAHGRDRVVVTLRSHGCELDLTPHQARVVATELIMAVNRAEVRGSLKQGPNAGRTAPTEEKRDLLGHAFFK